MITMLLIILIVFILLAIAFLLGGIAVASPILIVFGAFLIVDIAVLKAMFKKKKKD